MGIQLGIDVGSTTVKVVVIDNGEIKYKKYERHFSQVRQKALEMVREAEEFLRDKEIQVVIAGSAGFGISKNADIDFVQEVHATNYCVDFFDSQTDVIIELGGEDAKILFITGGLEERMNGSCAGGTGAFIDQMATLLSVSLQELDDLSLNYREIYPIASRCGVFSKSDIQPLLNQGAPKEDLAASIFQAVVNQTITGLAQGREIKGKVLFLGGPLYFFKGLRQRFKETLNLTDENAIFPDDALFSVAIGAAIYAKDNVFKLHGYDNLVEKLENATDNTGATKYMNPLFKNKDEYSEFVNRHKQATVPFMDIKEYSGNAYLGIDCGSTTTKLILIDENNDILYTYYSSNKGNPIDVVKRQLGKMYALCEDRVKIKGSVVTGYGEELIKNAFHIDKGIVETMAHFKAAKHFNPNVDFIIDIGGQDIKCFRIRNNAIDSIMLNEACSSGCGSFIETFAKSMNHDIETFSKKGLFAKRPVDLGSRCTVFMNSSVKQAQKEGATVEDTSAGLSISVVKNAIYKVIRARNVSELGENIVVQGGTFLNDAVLRCFEKEIDKNVTRPEIAGLMGAYGAALTAKDLDIEKSFIMDNKTLNNFVHSSKATVCGLCGNKCNLTINTFEDGRKFISGNMCERPNGVKVIKSLPNMYEYKLKRLLDFPSEKGKRGKIGLPFVLNMYEDLWFWAEFFTALGFEVITTKPSTRGTYTKGQNSVPSDTVCYPGKIVHGHIEELVEMGIDTIFYPSMTYNFDEEKGDNHYNCPVVAYYPELIHSNMSIVKDIKYMYPYLGVHRKKDFKKKIFEYLLDYYPDLTLGEVSKATNLAYGKRDEFKKDIRNKGAEVITYARENNKTMIVLSGRPYHLDPEINHGIDRLLASLDMVVLTEDCVSDMLEPIKVNVLNQWTYHSRLYNAAKVVSLYDDMELIQLISFGCGLDAVTSDEVQEILEESGKFYTQLKIDEISNLGAVKIRIRSLLGAMEEKKGYAKSISR